MTASEKSSYRAAQAWLFSLVRDPEGTRFFAPKTTAVRRVAMAEGMARLADFLTFTGHPERACPAVYVAGTSGKGSVTMTLAALLKTVQPALGVAHHTSPYLQEPLEKLVLNDSWLAPSAFVALVASFRAQHEAWAAQTSYDQLRYGEAWVGLTFWWLAHTAVDWAIIEAGMGGRFDPTNLLPAQLSIITNIGWDHVGSLGPTLTDIAWHKAGIIKERRPVLTAVSDPELLAVLVQEAATKNAPLYALGRDIHLTRLDDGHIRVQTPWRAWPAMPLPNGAGFHAENVALALAGLDVVAQEAGWLITDEAVTAVGHTLRHLHLPGRMEQVATKPVVILDGAHNPPKVAALVASMRQRFPDYAVTAVVGALVSKDVQAMLAELLPLCTRLIATEPPVPGKPALSAQVLGTAVGELAPTLPLTITPEPATALAQALAFTQNEPNTLVLVTGSIYLVGAIRHHWYPSEHLLQIAATTGHHLR